MTKTQYAAARGILAASIAVAAGALSAAGCTEGNSAGQTSSPPTSGSGQNSLRVPQNARRIAEATGTRLVHRPLRDGTIYVQDKTTGGVVYGGPVRANDNVVIDPRADAVTVNDTQVKHAPKLVSGHTYRLFFVQR